MTILVLGGTAEARQLATALVTQGVDVISSLAGRVSTPNIPAGRVRVGGFGGAGGLANFLRREHASAVVDATHPFAARITKNVVDAASITGTPLIRLERPGWGEHPHAKRWTWVSDSAAARAAADSACRPFLTTGRQSLLDFAAWADRDVLVRLVDLPATSLPQRWNVILSRGPYSYEDEHAILTEHAIDAILTKDSGGTHTVAKLDAADDLGIPVVIIARPQPAPVPLLRTVAEATAWCRSIHDL
jgi:precorrin-6A/cobalt-precorrin-6A reductase